MLILNTCGQTREIPEEGRTGQNLKSKSGTHAIINYLE